MTIPTAGMYNIRQRGNNHYRANTHLLVRHTGIDVFHQCNLLCEVRLLSRN